MLDLLMMAGVVAAVWVVGMLPFVVYGLFTGNWRPFQRALHPPPEVDKHGGY